MKNLTENYFKDLNENEVHCKLHCQVKPAYRKSTTTLHSHLGVKNPAEGGGPSTVHTPDQVSLMIYVQSKRRPCLTVTSREIWPQNWSDDSVENLSLTTDSLEDLVYLVFGLIGFWLIIKVFHPENSKQLLVPASQFWWFAACWFLCKLNV